MPADELDPGRRPPTRAEVRARALVVAGIAAILLVIVAAATSGGFALGDRDGSGGLVAPRLPSFAAWILVPLLLLAVVASLTVMTQVVVGRQTPRPARMPIWAQLATLIFVVLSVVALQQAGILQRDEGRGRPGAEATTAPKSPDEGADSVTRSRALGVAVTVVLVVVLAGILLLMFSILRKERGRIQAPGDAETDALLEAVDAGIEDLSNIEDPRAAVIACYARLESSLRATGLARRPSEAPLEFLERVLVERRVLEESAGRLTALFERARFSPHEVDESMRGDALAALREARDRIGALA
jgi:hypothetical protein